MLPVKYKLWDREGMTTSRGIEGFTTHDDDRFIESVRRLREEKGWSQGELARRIQAAGVEGFHQTTVSRIEKGERPVRLGEARALAHILGTSVDRMVAPDLREGRITAVEAQFWAIHEDAEKIERLAQDVAWNDRRLRDAVSTLSRIDDWADADLAKRAAEQLSRAESYLATPLEEQLHALISTALQKEREKHDGQHQETP
ncbi:helix-turn-helix transcriptional regulator [Kocuria rosea]|uniref:helix-turn-helix transcriptional regulator n=1 Tax=Kocuria rosea TaxID=1275 RepID=UPI000D656586|nr:helix-turn-helix transcriptional regulator [Kocuria rosea]PWF82015.1 hypothetical protein DEJ37_15930 [Kocuria rosea]